MSAIATIHQDGRQLVGREWIKPTDYQSDEVASRELPSLKGSTPLTMPSLDDQE